jgi:hypothetical protein
MRPFESTLNDARFTEENIGIDPKRCGPRSGPMVENLNRISLIEGLTETGYGHLERVLSLVPPVG